jgi:hypothetical protein
MLGDSQATAPMLRITRGGWLRTSMPRSVARRSNPARRSCRALRPAPRPTIPSGLLIGRDDPLPVFEQVLPWLHTLLSAHGYPRPLLKRLALLVTGLLDARSAGVADLAETLKGLAITPAKEPSIVRRLQRTESDPRLDPALVLPTIFRALLPTLLASARAAHAANVPSGPTHHARFVGVRLVVDATTKGNQAHILTVGLAYQGIVLPLAVRVWEQNVPLPAGQYLAELASLLEEVNQDMPPELRDHLLLLADRGFGTPRLLDLVRAFGWHCVLRVQNQTTVRTAAGHIRPIRELAPAPGRIWITDATHLDDPDVPLAAFKTAGWRTCNAVAVWLEGEEEPWLLLTDLDASLARMHDYAQRWAIERLFLSWKSHGFDLEQAGLTDLARIRHLLTGLVLATLWLLAAAVPLSVSYLDQLATHTHRHGYQYPLPLELAPALCPWPAKFSLFTWGMKMFHQTDLRRRTPDLSWTFLDWDAPRWSQQCLQAYAGAR